MTRAENIGAMRDKLITTDALDATWGHNCHLAVSSPQFGNAEHLPLSPEEGRIHFPF